MEGVCCHCRTSSMHSRIKYLKAPTRSQTSFDSELIQAGILRRTRSIQTCRRTYEFLLPGLRWGVVTGALSGLQNQLRDAKDAVEDGELKLQTALAELQAEKTAKVAGIAELEGEQIGCPLAEEIPRSRSDSSLVTRTTAGVECLSSVDWLLGKCLLNCKVLR